MERIFAGYTHLINSAKSFIGSVSLPWRRGTGKSLLRMTLVTGDKKGAGTDANVHVIIHDSMGQRSRVLCPAHTLRDDHERGTSEHYEFDLNIGVDPPFESVEIWRDHFFGASLPFGLDQLFAGGKGKHIDDWFLDRVEISVIQGQNDATNESTDKILNKINTYEDNLEETRKNYPDLTSEKETTQEQTRWVFPVHRWIEVGVHYVIPLYDALLPQQDPRGEFRLCELEKKRKTYQYVENVPGGPIQVKDLPSDENFSERFYWTFVEKRASLMVVSRLINWTTPHWHSLEDLQDVFKLGLNIPEASSCWKEDWWFGLQRVQGVDPSLIRLCEAVPQSIDVPINIDSLLEGKDLVDAVNEKRIFVCDLKILKNIKCKKDRKLASPLALFYLTKNNDLLPILIQLRQEKSPEDPIFTPLDHCNTWLVAKMFYNNAEAQYHQSITHLGYTHLIMEGVCATVHRNLSTSHPLYRLLAPHFLYLIAINKRGEEKLINPGGWVDSTMTQGTEGMFALMAKRFQEWNFQNLNPSYEIGKRGVIDPQILPYYPYRDDATEIFEVIQKYVGGVVARYYGSASSIKDDWELQNFRKELISPFPRGLGFSGVPGTLEEGFSKVEEVVETLSCIISTCTIGHAAANSQQYEQYGFVPNYPGSLTKDPPKEKVRYSESDIVSLLPSKEATLDTIVITKLLSSPITNPLGDFEVQHLYHPEDVKVANTFQEELKNLSHKINEINRKRKRKYEDLIPDLVPNSISV